MATNKHTIFLTPILAVLVGLGLSSCESTPLTGPEDGELRLSVSQITIDEASGATQGTGTLAAQLFDAAGRAMIGAQVTFTSPYGTLASGGPPNYVETDSRGIAVDQLTLTLNDPETVEVSAFSGKLTASETVTRTSNPIPVAAIVASPDAEQVKGRTVTFSGAGSTGQILCHEWVIDTTLAGVRTETVQASGAPTSIQRTYGVEQGLDVTLRVSSHACAADPTTTQFNGTPDSISYEILCDLTPPVADAGADTSTTSGIPVLLDGSQSRDPDPSDSIATYRWSCPGGILTTTSDPAVVMCTYTLSGSTTQLFTATLTVTNQCGLSDDDRVNITVTP